MKLACVILKATKKMRFNMPEMQTKLTREGAHFVSFTKTVIRSNLQNKLNRASSELCIIELCTAELEVTSVLVVATKFRSRRSKRR